MKIIGKETLYVGRKFSFAAHVIETKSGERIQREFVDHPGGVVMAPMLSENRIVLLRNYRHAIDQTLWELPAGTLQAGESFEETAVRELQEETGYHAGSMERLTDFYAAPGATNERMRLFVARDLTAGEPRRESDEEMEVHLVDFDRALAMTYNGDIVDGKTILGLWHLANQRAIEGRKCTTG